MGDGSSIDIVTSWLADQGSHNKSHCKQCCYAYNCFVTLLRSIASTAKDLPYGFMCFERLFRGFHANQTQSGTPSYSNLDTVCLDAICAVLGLDISKKRLIDLYKNSDALSIAASCHGTKLTPALLEAGIDVDDPDVSASGLTLLQLLCQRRAPESCVALALARTKNLALRTNRGDTLIHLALRFPISTSDEEAATHKVVELLIEAGVDINARSKVDGMTALMMTVDAGSFSLLNLLLYHGADIEACDDNGGNVLTHASRAGDSEFIRSLLDHGCPFVYTSCEIGGRKCVLGPLQEAATAHSSDALEMLYERGEHELETETKLEVPSSLWVACACGPARPEHIRLLLAKGANVHYQCPADGSTPLHNAAVNGHSECIKLLLDAGSNPGVLDDNHFTASMYAIVNDHPEVAKLLAESISARTTSHEPRSSMYRRNHERAEQRKLLPDIVGRFAGSDDISSLKHLVLGELDMTLRFRSCECTPIVSALLAGQVAVVEYLQDIGVDICGSVCYRHGPQHFLAVNLLVVQYNMLGPLERFLRSFSSRSTLMMQYMIHCAVAAGNNAALDLILAQDSSLARTMLANAEWSKPTYTLGFNGFQRIATFRGTPLHTAVLQRQHRCAETLLGHAADPNLHDRYGVTPMHLAAMETSVEILQLLLLAGAELDPWSSSVATPLWLATNYGNAKMVRHLLELGADIQTVNENGRSVFSAAAGSGNIATFLGLSETRFEPSVVEIVELNERSFRSTLMLRNYFQLLVGGLGHHLDLTRFIAMPLLKFIPLYLRRLYITLRCKHTNMSPLYRDTICNNVHKMRIWHKAGAMLNLEGGPEGTPLMAACKTGRFDAVKYLVGNGAVLSYSKNGRVLSAIAMSSSHPKIQRWLLVERFSEQRTITVGELLGEEMAPEVEGDANADDIADVTLDLVLAEEVERYLQSKNWFLPMRYFIDSGDGAFDKVPILPADFARYRPAGYHSAP
jgi:ankyrin repeat protein